MWLIYTTWLTLQATAAPTPQAIAEKVQHFYDGTQDFKADFRQTLNNTVFGRKQTFDGTVKIKKPGKMRWDYVKPDKKLFVSDGKILWVYEPEDNQAFKQALAESALPSAVTFLFGQGKLLDEFDVTAEPESSGFGDSGDYVLRMTPKVPTARYKSLVLDVDAKTYQVKQTIIFDTQGNTNTVAFRKIELNTKLSDALFKWSPPAGTKIVKP